MSFYLCTYVYASEDVPLSVYMLAKMPFCLSIWYLICPSVCVYASEDVLLLVYMLAKMSIFCLYGSEDVLLFVYMLVKVYFCLSICQKHD